MAMALPSLGEVQDDALQQGTSQVPSGEAVSEPDDGAGFQPLSAQLPQSWGCAPGWYSRAPSALKRQRNPVFGSAKGAFHISLGRSPRILSQRAKGLKARSITGFETNSAAGTYMWAPGRRTARLKQGKREMFLGRIAVESQQ